ncbi:DNA mismatch repair endonuclease MutL [uncultured Gemmiger sp.]|uniref:DNA mismatch repair endonuclease MutL n=1 Tax=uncultured Gemmiger sp. TaxID=1623490 RepID=UPI0025D1EF79|nr:DNA mismatch repair endonuclease MutL [uncultured Gemmiger sp.]
MAEIRVLDKHTSELIAAGEVVERPASVAKELLENAIDAGATKITLSIRRGGIELLQIVDNGTGIEAEYIDKAFIRHATSKIKTAEDLNSIHTLGFRGEALASIASVARVEVLTRTQADEYACLYRIAGGEEQGMEPGARPVGTTITVRDLFYNTPARMKFLKKDASEGTFVADVVLHTALSHPEISFRFEREGKLQFVTPGDGKLISAVHAAVGRDFARDLLPVEGELGVYQVTGLVTPPRACRASRGAQYFYVNGRYVKNRTMMAAMENAYKGTLMQGKFPGGVLMLTLPAELVDVNVHPAKTEIRFAREGDVFDAVYRAVRNALTTPGSGECRFSMDHGDHGKQQAAQAQPAPPQSAPQAPARPAAAQTATPHHPGGGFATMTAAQYRAARSLTDPIPPRPVPGISTAPGQGSIHAVRADYDKQPTPAVSVADAVRALGEVSEAELDILPDLTEEENTAAVPNPPADASAVHTGPVPAPAAGEAPAPAGQPASAVETAPQQTSFVPEPAQETEEAGTASALSALPTGTPEQTTLAPTPQSEPLRLVGEVFRTYIITERAGELCLIDKHAAHERILFEKLSKDYGNVPAQMLLVPVQVNLSAEEKLAVLQNQKLLEDAGIEAEDYGGATVIVRAVPADVPVDDVEDMLIELAARLARGGDALREKTEWVLHSIACRAAVKAGDRSDPSELLALAQQILDGSVPPFCPHGRPCVLKITRKELEKQFGRIV